MDSKVIYKPATEIRRLYQWNARHYWLTGCQVDGRSKNKWKYKYFRKKKIIIKKKIRWQQNLFHTLNFKHKSYPPSLVFVDFLKFLFFFVWIENSSTSQPQKYKIRGIFYFYDIMRIFLFFLFCLYSWYLSIDAML